MVIIRAAMSPHLSANNSPRRNPVVYRQQDHQLIRDRVRMGRETRQRTRHGSKRASASIFAKTLR